MIPYLPMNEMKLNDEELRVLKDADFFRIRQDTEVKIRQLFAELKLNLKPLVDSMAASLPAGCTSSGKISRGERHEGFPWCALDYPAMFSREDIFAFRSLLVWGHHFSFHLILSGSFLRAYSDLVYQNAPALEAAGFKKAMHQTPWEWLNQEYGSLTKPGPGDDQFLRIAGFLPIDKYAELPQRGVESWQLIASILFAHP